MTWFTIFSFFTEESEEEIVPTMNDNIIPRRPVIPALTPTKNGHANPATATYRPKTAPPSYSSTPIQTTTTGRTTSTTNNAHNIIQAAHPQDNEIAGSVNIR